MAREPLQRASDELTAAAELADGKTRERLETQADQLAALATRESGPDHGRLARHMNALHELESDTDGEVRDHVVAARKAVSDYRETVEGV
ncbi:MAG: hypothetical protein ABEJ82_10140 [Haloplanus sp.]